MLEVPWLLAWLLCSLPWMSGRMEAAGSLFLSAGCEAKCGFWWQGQFRIYPCWQASTTGVSPTQAAHLQGVFKMVLSFHSLSYVYGDAQGLFGGWTGTSVLLHLPGVSSLSSTKSTMWISRVVSVKHGLLTVTLKSVPFLICVRAGRILWRLNSQ